MPGPQCESNHMSTGYCRKPAGRIYADPLQRSEKNKKPLTSNEISGLLAGVEGFEPSARGFGDRCSTN